MSGETRRGTVSSFDEAVGLGQVDDGGRRYLFHCTQIAGGSRSIAPGTPVEFHTVPRHGRWEAAAVTPQAP